MEKLNNLVCPGKHFYGGRDKKCLKDLEACLKLHDYTSYKINDFYHKIDPNDDRTNTRPNCIKNFY